MLFIGLFKIDTIFFIYYFISLVIYSAIPLTEGESADAEENSTSVPEDKITENVSNSDLNNKIAKVMESWNTSKTNLAHDKNDSQVSVSSAVAENKNLSTAAQQDGNLSSSLGGSSSFQKTVTAHVEKISSPPPPGGADQIPEYNAVNSKETESNGKNESVMKKETDKEPPPLPPSEKQDDSVPKQPPQKADEDDNNIKDADDKSEEREDLKETEKSTEITEQDDDNIEKEMEEEEKNSGFKQTDEKSEKDESNNFNGNPVSENIESHPRKIFPNKNGILYNDTNSHFFAYFLTLMVMAVLFYLLFHNKQRIIALMIEGRQGRPSRRAGSRAKYHKLDNNLEEAMTSTRGGEVEGGSGPLGKIY